ncbi:ABC transporter permease [Halovenus sp. WSH3]|uniref:ABC transporter permease n=1 Tax=Halovenus carboxidivorans TaxID=2692199 RepID=A0A6B0T4L1_9EURY|nr:ABC transporter permease [Halovenus carboxidivorans]MXR50453.1 ABC transporter permease [Halovenus carboxidivorans]
MTRVGTAFRSGLAELRRTPLLVALLIVGPAYVVSVFAFVAPDGPAVLHLGDETVRTTLSKAFPAMTTPMTAALLSGIAGLFLMETAAAADARLVVAGYRPREVVLARLGLVAGVAVIATGVSVGMMRTTFRPEHLGWFLLGVGLTALTYGLLGLLVGVVLDRLVGVYLVLFGSMIDLFIFQNPLATDPPALARLLPGHYPLELSTAAGFTGDVAVTDILGACAYLAVLTGLAIAAFYREMELS